ncbi:expressed unknown protein [Seminavis robusta]|uniref:Uncharacterized protein n=1 Tax=Seminavis robusta TaxID=568900 RepID=A0A9N8EQS4_9STRA|nr:expressed unknown protein [Seminavis robusta]|eukprot:Sro1432_g272100.1 n/a (475) ;mRNA; f:9133-10557
MGNKASSAQNASNDAKRYLTSGHLGSKKQTSPPSASEIHYRSKDTSANAGKSLQQNLSTQRRDSSPAGRENTNDATTCRTSPTSNDRPKRPVSSKILEKTEWLSQLISKADGQQESQQFTTNRVSPHRTSNLVADRLSWIQSELTSHNNNDVPSPSRSSSVAKRRKSEFVADRMRRFKESLEQEMVPPTNKQERLRGVDSQLLEGLASNRSKTWLLQSTMTTATNQAKTEENRTRPGKLQADQFTMQQMSTVSKPLQPPKKPGKLNLEQLLVPTTSRGARKRFHRTNTVPLVSVAEKRERFLAASQNPPRQRRIVRKEPTNFFQHCLTEWEQEGLLPDFVADHTTWLFGEFSDNHHHRERQDHCSLVNQLRLDNPQNVPTPDASPSCGGGLQPDSPCFSPDTQSEASAAVVDTIQDEQPTDQQHQPEVWESSPSAAAKQLDGPLPLQDTKWKDVPWADMTYGEMVVLASEKASL